MQRLYKTGIRYNLFFCIIAASITSISVPAEAAPKKAIKKAKIKIIVGDGNGDGAFTQLDVDLVDVVRPCNTSSCFVLAIKPKYEGGSMTITNSW